MKSILFALFLCVSSLGWAQERPEQNLEDFDFLTSFTEENYAAFPAIMELGYEKKYKALKKRLRKQVAKGKVGIEKAACEYAIWFHKNFDSHYSVVTPLWHEYWKTAHKDYSEVMAEYAPKPVSCKVDEHTWLVRVPSCMGNNPTKEWVRQAAEQYKASGCENLIIDIRGNGGGSDDIWYPFIDLLVDHQREWTYENFFRNTPYNVKAFFELALEVMPDNSRVRDFITQCKNSNNEFERWSAWDASGIEPATQPKRVAVIADNASASASETLIWLYAKDVSHRTKIYGKERTYGADLTGNCVSEAKLPHADIRIFYPTCVATFDFLDHASFGKVGIEPDVYIDLPYPERLTDDIDEWVLWVAKHLSI